MARKRSSNFDLPPRMHIKGSSFYYVTGTKPRRWIALGSDLKKAKYKWAELESGEAQVDNTTFAALAKRYQREIFPTKAPRTQKDNEKESVNLLAVFGPVPIDSIRPTHVRQYLDTRGTVAPIRVR